MFPDRSSAKDYERLDSPDQESLLRSDGSQEKLLPSLPAPAKRNKNLKTYLHIAAVAFYSIITILLFIWSTRLNAQKCDCENASISSPANTVVKYEQKTIVHKLADKNKYRGPPRPEVDEAWEELLQYNNIRIQKDELDDANLTSVPLNDEKGGYLASLDVFHTLHCVNNIRKAYYDDYYQTPGPVESHHEHFDHCIDLLREVLMCHGDVSLHTYGWKDEYPRPWPTMQTTHQCRNWDELVKWSKDRAVADLSGPILTHPTLGISYPKEDTPA